MSAANDFHKLRLASVEPVAGDGLVLTFDVPAALAERFRFKPGQHIAVRQTIDGEELRRNYSIAAGPGEPLRVAIKRVEGGRYSTWAHANLKAGDTIEVMAPAGRFVLPVGDGSPRRVVMFAAGSGITPIMGITRQVLMGDAASTLTLVYGNRRRGAVLFGDELEALKDRFLGRLELINIFSADDGDAALFEGRIDADKVRALSARLIDYARVDHFYLCGPGSLIKDARKTLMDIGVPVAKIQHEFFAAGGGAFRAGAAAAPASTPASAPGATAARETGADVTVILDGVRHRLVVPPGRHVLDVALKAGLKAPYACAGGMCSTCRARIVEGTADMTLNYSLEDWEIAKGFVLTCQAKPTSDRLVIDYDAM